MNFKYMILIGILFTAGNAALLADPNSDLSNAASGGSVADVQKALAAGANINSTDQDGYTALMKAALVGQFDVVKYLVGTGKANVNARNRWGVTALMLDADNTYADKSSLEIAKILVEAKADVNAKDNQGGLTALMYAIGRGNLPVVKYLVEVGKADVKAKDDQGRTVLNNTAALARNPEIQNYLRPLMGK